MSSLGRHLLAGAYSPVGSCYTGRFDVGSFIWRPAGGLLRRDLIPTERLSRPSTRS